MRGKIRASSQEVFKEILKLCSNFPQTEQHNVKASWRPWGGSIICDGVLAVSNWIARARVSGRGTPPGVTAQNLRSPAVSGRAWRRVGAQGDPVRGRLADTAVADGVLTTSMGELRKVLGETAKQPQYIATVHRRGYRFIAPVTLVDTPETSDIHRTSLAAGTLPPDHALPSLGLPGALLVDRDLELARLHQWFRDACHGQRHMVFVTGEAGIGKTTLVDVFLTQLTPQQPRGRWGVVSALLIMGLGKPICRCWKGASGRWDRPRMEPACSRVLRQHAPSWLLQLPDCGRRTRHLCSSNGRSEQRGNGCSASSRRPWRCWHTPDLSF